MVNQTEGRKLIQLARQSITSAFSHKQPEVPEEIRKLFSPKQGGFVTLTIGNELRGCIGFVEPVFPLYETITRAAQAAAFEDPRFPPLQKEEFKLVKIEISVLTLPELIRVENVEDYPKKIKIGEDGLIIRGSIGSGLLLPQVFTEYHASPKKALEMTCQKAGLSPDAWKNPSSRIYKFKAEIFSEK